ncbi:T9SS type A sorting domain-containing protein [candidate division FCPU426 bacterium]|nr:T9SS type A sorting domain-containing protein [candidate division FCPU426 bacterium]
MTISPTASASPEASFTPDYPGGLGISQVYPNPARDVMYFLADCGTTFAEVMISIYNPTGEQVAGIHESARPGVNRLVWHCQDMPAGVYYVIMEVKGHYKKNFKIAIEK